VLITATNPFKGRQFPGEVIILCVRWYLRNPLAYEHVAELLAERGVAVDPSCISHWVQTYAPPVGQALPPISKVDEQKLPHGRDIYKGERRGQVSVPSGSTVNKRLAGERLSVNYET
jgi:hypothetical protein